MLIAIGSIIGVTIIIAASVSIKQPIISNKRLINKIITNGFSDIESIVCAICSGILSIVNNLPKAVAIPTMTKIVAEVKADSARTFGKSFSFSSLYKKNPTNRPKTTATPAASVGVKIPP